jgi:hypothetical protein
MRWMAAALSLRLVKRRGYNSRDLERGACGVSEMIILSENKIVRWLESDKPNVIAGGYMTIYLYFASSSITMAEPLHPWLSSIASFLALCSSVASYPSPLQALDVTFFARSLRSAASRTIQPNGASTSARGRVYTCP